MIVAVSPAVDGALDKPGQSAGAQRQSAVPDGVIFANSASARAAVSRTSNQFPWCFSWHSWFICISRGKMLIA